MGCRIDYGNREGVLRAVVSGKSSLAYAAWMARNIAEQAAGAAAECLLIDLRRLQDRVGTLRALLAEGDGPAASATGRLPEAINDDLAGGRLGRPDLAPATVDLAHVRVRARGLEGLELLRRRIEAQHHP